MRAAPVGGDVAGLVGQAGAQPVSVPHNFHCGAAEGSLLWVGMSLLPCRDDDSGSQT